MNSPIKASPYLQPLTVHLGATFEYEFEVRLNNIPVDPDDIAEITLDVESLYSHETGANAIFSVDKTGGEITATTSGDDTIVRIEVSDTVTNAIDFAELRYGRAYYKITIEFTSGEKRVYSYGEIHFIGNVVGI